MDTNTNPQYTNVIFRAEYEARQAELRADIRGLESKIDVLSAKIDNIMLAQSTQASATTAQISNMKADAWKYVATSLLSVLSGGAIYALGEFIITHHF